MNIAMVVWDDTKRRRSQCRVAGAIKYSFHVVHLRLTVCDQGTIWPILQPVTRLTMSSIYNASYHTTILDISVKRVEYAEPGRKWAFIFATFCETTDSTFATTFTWMFHMNRNIAGSHTSPDARTLRLVPLTRHGRRCTHIFPQHRSHVCRPVPRAQVIHLRGIGGEKQDVQFQNPSVISTR